MKICYNILLGIIITLLSCCQRGLKTEDAFLQVISLDEAEKNTLTDEDVLNALHLVRLETTDNCLIDQIRQVEIYEDKFYILDNNNKLLVFDRQGKFIQQIGSQGMGPAEYINATHFYINPIKKYICVLDMATAGAIRYSLSGEYICRNRMQVDFTKIVCTAVNLIDNENVLFQSSNSPTDLFNYLVVNEHDISAKSFQMPFLGLGEEGCSSSYTRNCNAGEKFYAMQLFSDTVYVWNKNRFIPNFVFESEMKHATKDIIEENSPYETATHIQVKLHSMGYSEGINRICSNKNYLYLEYFGLGYYDAVFWKISDNKGYLYRLSGSDNPLLHVYNNLMSTSQKALIRYLSVDMFYFAEDEIKACKHPELADLYKNMKEDDNPVLLLYDYDKLLNRLK